MTTGEKLDCLKYYKSELFSARGCTDFILMWCHSDTKVIVHRRFHPSGHGYGEPLHKRGEEEEKLHLGQSLTQTDPLT